MKFPSRKKQALILENPNMALIVICFRFICYVIRAEVEEFFANMDRDFDGKLSFAEFMGEETPLEKVSLN